MFSRYERDQLIEIVNRYIGEQITAFEFDKQLTKLAAETNDPTVRNVTEILWYHYDDLEDHKVVASKEQWDFFQRLLLVLESDQYIVSEPGPRRWTVRQALAAGSLIIFVAAAARTGFGWHLLWVTVPLGIVSLLLSHWRSRLEARRIHEQAALTPFASISELISLRRKLRNFTKARYPVHLGSRVIRSPITTGCMWIHTGLVWMIVSPAVLMFQVLPEREERWKLTSIEDEQLPSASA